MRIAIDAHIINSSTGRYVERLIFHLQKVDNTNEYIVILPKKDYASWKPTAKNFTKVAFDYKPYSLVSQLKLMRLLRRLRVDVTHFTFQPDVYTTLAPLLYRGTKVITVHDLTQLRIKNRKRSRVIYGLLHYGFKVLIRLNVWASSAVITPTKFVRDDVVKYLLYPKKKITVTYEAADPLPTSTSRTISALRGKRFILYVGTAHAHKNLPALVEAFRLLSLNHPELQLAFAGKKDVFYEQLARFTTQSGIEQVHFLGFVSDEELAWLYKNAVVYVFPSLSEGFGLPGLEAMLYKLPVASSNATCLPEVYGSGASYFDPTKPAGIAHTVGRILTDERLQRKLAEAGSRQVASYSWRTMAKQTLEVYQMLAKSKL